ncbi:MAG: hypothetical protein KF762_14080 [Acidobacteria bacterium]|nr:hypothetical protein [Acidobacteriota bacterium]
MTTQTKNHYEDTVDLFNENLEVEFPLVRQHNEIETADSSVPQVQSNIDRWSSVVRLALLFLPGSFLLYYSVLSAFFFAAEFGITFQMVFMILAGAFMCFAGVGKINEKHGLYAPLAVTASASLVALFASVFSGETESNLYFWYSIYFFPVALIAAVVSHKLSKSNDTRI